ncbi:MAG: hypothetical protein WC273_03735 [Dehalococcoidia bacterium]
MQHARRLPRFFVLWWVLGGLVVNILSQGQQFVEAGLLRWIGMRLSIRSWVIASLRAGAKAMLLLLAAAVPVVLLIGVLAVSLSVRQMRAAIPWLGTAGVVSMPTLFAWVIGGGAQAQILGAAGQGALAVAWRRVVTIGQLVFGALAGSVTVVESSLAPGLSPAAV